jgi:tetratricopeptide (TPR) repeat protein
LKQAISLATQTQSDRELSNAYYTYGWLYSIIGDYPQALHFIQESLKLAEKSGDLLDAAHAYDLMAGVFADEEDYKRALSYEEMAANSIVELNRRPCLCKINDTAFAYSIFQGFASIYEKMNQLDSAQKYTQMCSDAHLKVKGLKWAAASLLFGNIYLKRDAYTTALKHYRDGIALAMQTGYKKDLMDSYNGMAKTFWRMRQPDSSIIYANKVLKISRDEPYLIAKRDAVNLIADVYKSEKNNDSLATYLELTIAINDSLFSQRKVVQLQSMTLNEELRQQKKYNNARSCKPK